MHVRVYSYDYYNEELKTWCVSSFNWTTAEAILEHLSREMYNISIKVTHKDIPVEKLIENRRMPFVSEYVYEKLGIPEKEE